MQALLYTLTILLSLAGLIPLIRYDNWVFRAMEYPRLQKWVLVFATLLLWLLLGNTGGWPQQLATGRDADRTGLPYLPIAKREMKAVTSYWQSNDHFKLRKIRHLDRIGSDHFLYISACNTETATSMHTR